MKLVFACTSSPDFTPRYQRLTRAIQRTGRHTAELFRLCAFLDNDVAIWNACSSADLIVIQAENHPALETSIQRWKVQGKKVLLDLGLERLAGFEPLCGSLRLADAICVPFERMAESLRHSTAVVIVPDFIELDRYLNITPVAHEGIVLGWKPGGGDLAALQDSGILQALASVHRARPQVKVGIWESQPGYADRLGLPPEMIFKQPTLSLQEWPRPLAYVDIGLEPVLDPADERRGWTDLLEYMVMRIPWLASQTQAYRDLRPYGWLVRNGSGAWERVLLDMIDYLPVYQEEAMGEPYLFGISQGVDENIDRVLTAFSAVLESKSTERA